MLIISRLVLFSRQLVCGFSFFSVRVFIRFGVDDPIHTLLHRIFLLSLPPHQQPDSRSFSAPALRASDGSIDLGISLPTIRTIRSNILILLHSLDGGGSNSSRSGSSFTGTFSGSGIL